MELFSQYGHWLAAMAVLIGCSAFFSCSEAAFFYLRRQDRRRMQSGNTAEKIAAGLLDQPDRLLTAVLFWNLLSNIAYFTVASIVGILLGMRGGRAEAGTFALCALLTLIVFSELIPKNLAVLQPRLLAPLVSIPLSAAVKALDPLMPAIRFTDLVSRRLFWPRFQAEPYLEIADLERAIELSTTDAALLVQEQSVLSNIVALSNVRVDELMRPRTQFLAFPPPVALADLGGRMTPSGYLLVTEPDSDEIAGAIPLKYLSDIPEQHLEYFAEKVIYVPWIATADRLLEEMRRRDRQVAAVVNEFGETIGIVTFDDILDTIFRDSPSRSARLLKRSSISEIEPNVWQVTGMTGVRRLAKHFEVELPPTKAVTVTGILQEVLQRFPHNGDRCRWGPFELEVLDASEQGQLTVQLKRVFTEEASP